MNRDLAKLMKLVPPPKKRIKPLNWEKVEQAIGIEYPASFKEFVDVYDSCIWYDHFTAISSAGSSSKAMSAYKKRVRYILSTIHDNQYDQRFKPTQLPLYPEQGGLFPFGQTFSGSYHCWVTRGKPERWPVLHWYQGSVSHDKAMSLPRMVLDWVQHKPHMVDWFGDVREFPDLVPLRCD